MTGDKDMIYDNTGGPAYPVPMDHWHPGMTLRDYFAGQALAIVMARFDSAYRPTLDDIATRSYLIADAMIAARAATNGVFNVNETARFFALGKAEADGEIARLQAALENAIDHHHAALCVVRGNLDDSYKPMVEEMKIACDRWRSALPNPKLWGKP